MKMLCPHCGVKGTVDDSFVGKKVKCPKCNDIFDVLPEENTVLHEDAESLATSPTTEQGISGDGEFPDDIEDALAAPPSALDDMPETESEIISDTALNTDLTEEEESLDWSDMGSEIEQEISLGDDGDEELDGDEVGDPARLNGDTSEVAGLTAELSSEESEESFEWSDIASEIEILDGNDEVSVIVEEEAPASLGQVIDGITEDSAGQSDDEIEPAHDEPGGAHEPEDEQLGEDIQNVPYGLEKECCSLCGKEDSVGEPFIAKDGKLYCTDCLPTEAMEEAEAVDIEGANLEGHDVASALRAQGLQGNDPELIGAKGRKNSGLNIVTAIKDAWEETQGAKGSIWAGSAVMYLVMLLTGAAGMFLLPAQGRDLNSVMGMVSNALILTLLDLISIIFLSGLIYMGVRKVAGDTLSWKMIFKGFKSFGKVFIAIILQTLLVSIGFLLLIVPGIYLAVGYCLTFPLILDRGLSPWQAMETSRKAIHKVWWKVLGLMFLMGLICSASSLLLGIGLIWTIPMSIVLWGVVFRSLFGVEKISG